MLAAVTDLAWAEKILRHFGLWQTVAQDPDIVAILGPPEVELWPPNELPPPDFDAVDEPGAEDWAA